MRTSNFILRFATLGLAISWPTNSYGQNVAAVQPSSDPASVSTSTSNSALPLPSTNSQLILGPADIIRINVWKNIDLTQTVTIGPDGFISLPLLGDVHVAGMTANQL